MLSVTVITELTEEGYCEDIWITTENWKVFGDNMSKFTIIDVTYLHRVMLTLSCFSQLCNAFLVTSISFCCIFFRILYYKLILFLNVKMLKYFSIVLNCQQSYMYMKCTRQTVIAYDCVSPHKMRRHIV